ncbi:hypothetical protein C5167_007369 [Papaver somniferum]|nr:hypothetical protein C5167_007369 [Papaver somniferum]
MPCKKEKKDDPLEEQKLKKISEGNNMPLAPPQVTTTTRESLESKLDESKDGKKDKKKAHGNQEFPSNSEVTTKNNAKQPEKKIERDEKRATGSDVNKKDKKAGK